MSIEYYGVYYDIDEDDYHADSLVTFGPTLSASGAKVLLRDPALFAYERANPKASSKSMDTGSIAHLLVLGRGSRVTVVPCVNWLKKADQEAKKEIIASGAIAANLTEMAKAQAMADAVLTHPVAGPMFTGGDAEVTLYWGDPATDCPMRARLDYLTTERIVDLKSSADVGSEAFAKSCVNYGYRESAANYLEGVHQAVSEGWVGGGVREFVLVAVESSPPHRVAMYRFGLGDLEYGSEQMAKARALFMLHEAEGYPDLQTEIKELVMPAWAAGASYLGETPDDLPPEERF